MNAKSATTLLLIGGFCLASLFYFSSWRWAVTSGGDPWGYYAYLPAAFIHHDLATLEKTVAVRQRLRPQTVRPTPANPLGIGEALRAANGNYVIKYTMGIALLEAPFFAVAHAYAKLTGRFPANGFSLPYLFAIHLAGCCYALLGLFLLRKTLSRFFSEKIVLLTVAVVALSTNLYFFTVYAGVMAHAFQFLLFSLVMYATVRWYETGRAGHALLLGLACGMVALVRPTEIIILAVPLLFGVKNGADLRGRLTFLRSKQKQVALAALACCLAGLPQLLYWKWTTGQFLFYSYGGEGFDFLHPHIWRGLVGYKNGWLAYTPVMWLGIGGIFWLRRHVRDWFWPVAVFLPLHVYITYSWWCWYYINGFGSRPMVEATALMALPLASFFEAACRRKWAAWAVAGAVFFCTALNLFNTWQFSRSLLWTEMGRGAYYWRMFGKVRLDYLDLAVFDSGEPQPDLGRITRSRVLHTDGFENTALQTKAERAFSGSHSLRLDGGGKVAAWQGKVGELALKRGDWVRLGVRGYLTGAAPRLYEGNFLSCRFLRSGKSRKSRSIRIESKVGNEPPGLWGGRAGEWGEGYFWVKVPPALRTDDVLEVGFYNENGAPAYLDDLSVELWR